MAFDLNTGFNTLSLRPDETSQHLSEFHLFSSLPAELRLKIIDQALPTHRTLQVKAEILVADADFGLYILFHLAPAVAEAPQVPVFGVSFAPRGWYTEARALDLLLVNKEIREYYIEKFPCSLPTSVSVSNRGQGRIRFSPRESIEISNFRQFVADSDFLRAMAGKWRLQKFFTEVEQILIPLDCSVLGCVDMLKNFSSLKLVKAKLWRNFSVDVNEDVKMQFRTAMRERSK